MDETAKKGENGGVILEDGYEWFPTARAQEWNPETHDFRWNADYSMFRPIALLWWDDASYLAYQSMP